MPFLDPLFPPDVDIQVSPAEYVVIDRVDVLYENNKYEVRIDSQHQFLVSRIEVSGRIINIKLAEREGSPLSEIELIMEDGYEYIAYVPEWDYKIDKVIILASESMTNVATWRS